MGTTASQLDKGMLSEYQVSVKSAVKMKVNGGTDTVRRHYFAISAKKL